MAVTAFLVGLVGLYYLWAVRATGTRFEWKSDIPDCYDLLSRAFLSGHLYLPIEPSPKLLAYANPWDPNIDFSIKAQDLALYNRRYYMYFGAAPAVVLFVPWRLITRHDLPERFGIFLLAFGGFLFSCGALSRVLDLANVKPGTFLLGFLILGLGLCQSVPYLLNRVAVYEIPIAGGYFFLSAALFCLARGIRSPSAKWWMAAAGLLFGGAAGSRPHLALAGMLAFGGLLWLFARRRGLRSAIRSREVIAFALMFMMVGAALATYNFERFGNPLEFGFRYQLAGPGQNRIELATRNLLPGFYFMLLSRPETSPVFPWMRMVFRFPFDSAAKYPLPPEYFIEPTVGALWIAPFLVAALFVPSKRRIGAEARLILGVAAGASVAILLFLMSTHLATHRYETDFAAIGVFAAIGNLGIYASQSAGWKRRAMTAAAAVVIVYSSVANLALGLAGPYDDVLKSRPKSYVKIARWFSPFEEYRPMLNPEIAVELSVRFVPAPEGFREPLITTGHWHYLHFLYVERNKASLHFVSQSDDSTATYDVPDPGGEPLDIQLRFSPSLHQLTVAVNQNTAISQSVPMLVSSPADVAIGRNLSDMGLTARQFTGHIHVIRKIVREANH